MLSIILKEKFNPKSCYLKYKAYKKIKSSNLFDEIFYLESYPEVIGGTDPLIQYIYDGYKEKKIPSMMFDGNLYLEEHKDVKNAGMNPLVHYVLFGKKERRDIYKKRKKSDKIKKTTKNNKDTLDSIQKTLNKHENILKSNNTLLNLIFSNFHIEAKGILRKVQLASFELLKFFDSVCKKHNLQYWLDYGTLLGSLRHNGLIPWDDDIDIGMMRGDYNKLLEILPQEISLHKNLSKNLKVAHRINEIDNQMLFLQVIYEMPLTHFDVFPYDYIKIDNIKSYKDHYYKIRKEYLKNVNNNIYNHIDGLSIESKKLGAVDSSEFIGTSLDGYPYPVICEKKDIFPLKSLNFEGKNLNVPNNTYEYLKLRYGESFMTIPEEILDHDRVDYVKNQISSEEIDKKYDELFKIMHEVNDYYSKNNV